MVLTFGLTPFLPHVFHVGRLITNKQMGGIYTAPIVAAMENMFVGGDGIINKKLPRKSVRSLYLNASRTASENAISAAAFQDSTGPVPTACISVN